MKVSDFRRALASIDSEQSAELRELADAFRPHDELEISVVAARIKKLKIAAPKPKAPRTATTRAQTAKEPKEKMQVETAVQLLSDTFYSDTEFAASLSRVKKSTITKQQVAEIYAALFNRPSDFSADLSRPKRFERLQQKRIEDIRFQRA